MNTFSAHCSQGSQVFGPDRRLHYSWEYRRFFDQSEVFRLSECTVFRIHNQLKHFRLGITLKARGSSVDRNRVKRQVRESIRVQGLNLGSYDYNIVIPNTKKLDYRYAKRLKCCLLEQLPQAIAGH